MQQAALSFQEVSKSFGKLTAVDCVSLTVEKGGFLGLLGPNGAGKTTLIHMLCGLNKITSGKIEVFGYDVARHPLETRQCLGVVPQELVYDPYFNVIQCLEIQSNYYGIRGNQRWIDELLERLDLAGKAKSRTRSLSGGMKRRLMIAQALVHKPSVIVLDEPTAGVDINLRQSMWEFISELNREGHTILLTTHYLEEAEELCDNIVMMNHGRIIAEGTKASLLERFRAINVTVRISGGKCPAAYEGRTIPEHTCADTGHYMFTLDDYGQIEEFMRDMRVQGVKIESMEIQHPDLEDIFINLLQEPAAEGAAAAT